MKKVLPYILLFIQSAAFSQSIVTGIVVDETEGPLPGVKIIETGTENSTATDLEGKFRIITTKDSYTLDFLWLGYDTRTIFVTGDTTLNVTLELYRYDSRWITVGAGYDIFNPTLSLLVSNGYNEHPITHFEDFTESWIYKIYGSTNFHKDYSLGFKFAHDYAFRFLYMPAIEFRKIEYLTSDIRFTDINLSTGIGFMSYWANILFKTGYQSLNGDKGIGAAAELQKSHYRIYYGFLVGYWVNYFTYEIYIQSFIYKHKLSLRAHYERIENYNFLNLGINYTFNR